MRADRARRTYTPEDREFAHLIGGRVALALENAGLFAELGARDRLTTALGHARRGGHDPGRPRRAGLRQRRGGRRARLRTRRAAAGHAAARDRRRLRVLPRGRLAAAPRAAARPPACWPGETPDPLVVRAVDAHRRGALADRQGDRGARRGRPRGQRDRGRHRGQARRARPALPRRRPAPSWPPRWTTSRRWPGSPSSPSRGSPTGARSALPDGDRLRTVARRARRSGQGRASRASTRSATRRRCDAPTGAPQVLRDGVSQLINDITDELLDAAIADPEQREAVRGLGMRAVMLVPMLARRARDRRDHASSAPSPGRSVRAPPTSSWPRSSAGAPAPRSRTPACTASARTSPRRSSAGCCPTRCRGSPGCGSRRCTGRPGAENLVGGDFYDAFPTAAGWMLLVGDVTGRGADGRRADRPGPAHAAHRRARLLGDPGRGAGAAQPRADRPPRADAVHGRDRPCHRRRPRTCCAPAIRSRC